MSFLPFQLLTFSNSSNDAKHTQTKTFSYEMVVVVVVMMMIHHYHHHNHHSKLIFSLTDSNNKPNLKKNY
jgi:hypothetical protein